MLYIISYDISIDQRRLNIAKLLEGYGQRVLKSVFECDLETAAYGRLRQRLERHIEVNGGDRLRIYQLCHSCRQRVDIIGDGPSLEQSSDIYIF